MRFLYKPSKKTNVSITLEKAEKPPTLLRRFWVVGFVIVNLNSLDDIWFVGLFG
jgi:hypothetical protein